MGTPMSESTNSGGHLGVVHHQATCFTPCTKESIHIGPSIQLSIWSQEQSPSPSRNGTTRPSSSKESTGQTSSSVTDCLRPRQSIVPGRHE